MRTPGPPPPRSWLGFEPAWQPKTAMGRKRKGKNNDHVERRRPETLWRFEKLVHENEANMAGQRQLLHMTMKRVAEQWEMLDEADYPALLDIPLRLRLRLLPYLGFHGPPIDTAALQALTQGDEIVTCLDLGGLAGHGSLSIKRLSKMLESIPDDREIAESWDAEPSLSTLTISPSLSRFSSLTKLCLSHPPLTVLWQDLLNFSKNTPQLTHLSLAHWPRPTLTPNLATATVTSQHGPDINAGGSNLYSGVESDRAEPAALLRQLSSQTLCLQWLDVEGCADWSSALSLPVELVNRRERFDRLRISEEARNTLVAVPPPASDESHWSETPASDTTIFCDYWKNVTYVNLAQGVPLPTLAGLEAHRGSPILALPDKHLTKQIYLHVQSQQTNHHAEAMTRDIYDVEKRKAAMWLEQESKLRCTLLNIGRMRQRRKMQRLMVDFGWATLGQDLNAIGVWNVAQYLP